jgi:hypothetical protein
MFGFASSLPPLPLLSYTPQLTPPQITAPPVKAPQKNIQPGKRSRFHEQKVCVYGVVLECFIQDIEIISKRETGEGEVSMRLR